MSLSILDDSDLADIEINRFFKSDLHVTEEFHSCFSITSIYFFKRHGSIDQIRNSIHYFQSFNHVELWYSSGTTFITYTEQIVALTTAFTQSEHHLSASLCNVSFIVIFQEEFVFKISSVIFWREDLARLLFS